MKNRTLAFGEGLFETFRVYEGPKLCFVEEHLGRMAAGCRFFDIPFSRDEAEKHLFSSLREITGHKGARLRLNLTTYGANAIERVAFSTETLPLPDMGKEKKEGVEIGLAPFRKFSGSPVVRFKTTSYIENILVFRQARRLGFFDAVFTNERKEITEGSISNIFFLKKDKIITPPVDAGLLPGITRNKVIELARSFGISTEEIPVPLDALDRFESAFVTNSVWEILPVKRIDRVIYQSSGMVPFIQKEYEKLIKGI